MFSHRESCKCYTLVEEIDHSVVKVVEFSFVTWVIPQREVGRKKGCGTCGVDPGQDQRPLVVVKRILS